MSIAAYVFFLLAWLVILGGVIYYITKGSKGDLDVKKAFFFILSCVSAALVLMLIGIIVA